MLKLSPSKLAQGDADTVAKSFAWHCVTHNEIEAASGEDAIKSLAYVKVIEKGIVMERNDVFFEPSVDSLKYAQELVDECNGVVGDIIEGLEAKVAELNAAPGPSQTPKRSRTGAGHVAIDLNVPDAGDLRVLCAALVTFSDFREYIRTNADNTPMVFNEPQFEKAAAVITDSWAVGANVYLITMWEDDKQNIFYPKIYEFHNTSTNPVVPVPRCMFRFSCLPQPVPPASGKSIEHSRVTYTDPANVATLPLSYKARYAAMLRYMFHRVAKHKPNSDAEVIDYFHKSIAAPLSKAGFFMEEQKKNITGWKASRDKDIKEKLKKAAEKAAK